MFVFEDAKFFATSSAPTSAVPMTALTISLPSHTHTHVLMVWDFVRTWSRGPNALLKACGLTAPERTIAAELHALSQEATGSGSTDVPAPTLLLSPSLAPTPSSAKAKLEGAASPVNADVDVGVDAGVDASVLMDCVSLEQFDALLSGSSWHQYRLITRIHIALMRVLLGTYACPRERARALAHTSHSVVTHTHLPAAVRASTAPPSHCRRCGQHDVQPR
ncbi:hypothetical protein EON66_07725 [archaeon]|nr:MAG: hypothetical protein EON66_07725 [archaeon]